MAFDPSSDPYADAGNWKAAKKRRAQDADTESMFAAASPEEMASRKAEAARMYGEEPGTEPGPLGTLDPAFARMLATRPPSPKNLRLDPGMLAAFGSGPLPQDETPSPKRKLAAQLDAKKYAGNFNMEQHSQGTSGMPPMLERPGGPRYSMEAEAAEREQFRMPNQAFEGPGTVQPMASPQDRMRMLRARRSAAAERRF